MDPLARFLRGQLPRRSNPPALSPLGPAWTLVSRSGAVTGNEQPPIPWTVEATASDEDMLRNEVQAQEHTARYGSVWVLRTPEDDVLDAWIATRRGLVEAGALDVELWTEGKDWVTPWEGPEARADHMIRVVEGSNDLRRRWTMASAACARTVLRFLPRDEESPRRAIEAAEAWARGEQSDDAMRLAQAACLRLRDRLVASGNRTATNAADAAGYMDSTGVRAAGRAEGYASDDFTQGSARALRSMAPLLRQFIPLSILLLARAGEDVPLSLRLP